MSDDDAAVPPEGPADPVPVPRAPHHRGLAGLLLGWVLLLPSALHLAMNPAAVGPLWSTTTTLAIIGLLTGVTLIASTRSTHSAG